MTIALESIQANVEKLRASVEHDLGVLQDKMVRFDSIYDGCRADEIRVRLQAAIDELQEKINRKKGWIAEQEAQIADIQDRLGNAN